MSNTGERAGGGGARGPGHRAYIPRVLVVERDRMTRLMFMQMLGRDAQLHVAGTAGLIAEAECLPAATLVDLVLLSDTVPDMDGVSGIQRLLRRFPAARLVVLAEDLSPARVTAAVRHGADGYLRRDIGAVALVQALQSVAAGEAAIPRSLMRGLVEELRRATPDMTAAAVGSLRPRERQVLQEIAQGRSNSEIAAGLGLSASTVKTYVSSILQKTGARSRFALQAVTPPERASA